MYYGIPESLYMEGDMKVVTGILGEVGVISPKIFLPFILVEIFHGNCRYQYIY